MLKIQFSIRSLLVLIAVAAFGTLMYPRKAAISGPPQSVSFFGEDHTAAEFRDYFRRCPRPIESVSLDGNLLTDDSIEGLADYQHAKRITAWFNWGGCGTLPPPTDHLRCHITDRSINILCKLQRLEELYLPQTEMTEAGIRKLAELPNLRKLHIAGSNIHGTGFLAFSSNCQLEELDLSRTPIRDGDLANIAHLKNLRILRLENTKVTEDGLQILQKLRKLEHLYMPTEDLSYTRVFRFFEGLGPKRTTPPMVSALQTFGVIGEFDKSQELRVYLGRHPAKHEILACSESCEPPVVSVHLLGADITPEIADLLAKIPTLRSVFISDADDLTLRRLKPLPRLQQLFLSQFDISGEIADHLRGFKGLNLLCLSDGSLGRLH